MNLTTQYLGLNLKNPLVPAASPLSKWLDGMKRMEDAGAAAVTMFSLFEEQIEHEMALLGQMLDYAADASAEASSYLPEPESYHRGPDEYLQLIADAKATLSIPVIASLNGSSTGGWVEFARQIAQAGADALELNVYWVETDPTVTGESVEARYLEVIRAVSSAVTIPVAVKLPPYFSSMSNMAQRCREAGAKGLVLFNRYYQPDFEIRTKSVHPSLSWSTSPEMRLPLHWTAILSGRVPLDLALTTGVHQVADVVKAIMAGAKIATFTSCLMQHGVGYLGRLVADLDGWLEANGYESVAQLRGVMSYERVANPSAFERGNYMKELQSFRPDPALLR